MGVGTEIESGDRESVASTTVATDEPLAADSVPPSTERRGKDVATTVATTGATTIATTGATTGASAAATTGEISDHVVRALVRATDTLGADYDFDATIQHLIDATLALIPGAEVSVILVEAPDTFRLAGDSSERKRVLEQYQIDHNSGPSIETLGTGEPSEYERIDAQDYPWPGFAQLARVVGYALVRTFPLRLRNETVGVLSIAETSAVERPALQDSLIRALADSTTIGYLNRRMLSASQELSRQLQGALTTRVLIEQSKGVVAAHLAITVDQAFELLRSYARGTNRKLNDVAKAVVDGSLTANELSLPRHPPLTRPTRRPLAITNRTNPVPPTTS